jgi:hypothetical protein
VAKEIRREHLNINHLSPYKEGNRSRRLTNASNRIIKYSLDMKKIIPP